MISCAELSHSTALRTKILKLHINLFFYLIVRLYILISDISNFTGKVGNFCHNMAM